LGTWFNDSNSFIISIEPFHLVLHTSWDMFLVLRDLPWVERELLMKEVMFFTWDPVNRNYNLTEEKIGEIKPSELDSVFVTETGVKFYLRKYAK
jgi:hypothetical protein